MTNRKNTSESNEVLEKKFRERIEEIESKFAFQEDMLDALNQVVTEQSKEIQKLWDANRILKASLEEQKLNQESIPVDTPPHY